MTRKDYILIAAALRRAKPSYIDGLDSPSLEVGWARSVESIADALTLDNPRLDRGRFYAACEA